MDARSWPHHPQRSVHLMCRKLLLTATAMMALAAAPAALAASSAAPKLAPAAAADSAPPTPPAAPPRKKASPQERAAADRLDPLARSAFWAREVDIDPTDTVAGVRLAAALRAMGQYNEAIQSAQQVLVVDADNYDALMESARDFIGEGQGFYAIDPLKKAIAQTPRDWRPLSLLGVAYSQVQRADDAQAVWRQALALSPDNPDVLSNMAMAIAAAGDAPQAETLLRRAVAQPNASLQVRQNLTLILGLQGKLAEAEKLLREDLPPQMADANLAYLQAASARTPTPSAPAGADHSWTRLKGEGG
jgi:Flp pilus assembly protein TadD